MRRDFDMAASVALGSGHKVLVLRRNPDAFKVDRPAGRLERPCLRPAGRTMNYYGPRRRGHDLAFH